MPTESEKKACPSAASTVWGVTFEKSGRNRKRTPSSLPGISSEWPASTTSTKNSSGIRNLAERSMPFRTPSAITPWVISTKIQA